MGLYLYALTEYAVSTDITQLHCIVVYWIFYYSSIRIDRRKLFVRTCVHPSTISEHHDSVHEDMMSKRRA
jgi:hypothetical protein